MNLKSRLLVAEDSSTQAVQIRRLLEDEGFELDIVENGREALEQCRQTSPDIVVTDLEMPEMNGLELVEALQQEFPKLPVVLITAKGNEDIAAQALRKGATSYVPKKYLNMDLAPTLNRILAVIRARRASNRLNGRISRTGTEYILDNDDTIVPYLIERFQEDVKQLHLCDEGGLFHIATALDEALVNAIVHGNLEVSSSLREIDAGKPYSELINQRKNESPYSDRKVTVQMKANREKAVFVIRDEGPGFDPRSIPDPTDPANLEKASGRGLMLINSFMDNVSHNTEGNEITMVKRKSA